MNKKRDRQTRLKKLLRNRPLATQDEMVRLLKESGFPATQSSISRDVRELGFVRLNGRYIPATKLTSSAPEGLPDRDNELIISVQAVGANLVIVKTPPGAANAVAIDLDRRGFEDVVGTVAGDDTIFVAVRSRAGQGRLLATLHVIGISAVAAPPPEGGPTS